MQTTSKQYHNKLTLEGFKSTYTNFYLTKRGKIMLLKQPLVRIIIKITSLTVVEYTGYSVQKSIFTHKFTYKIRLHKKFKFEIFKVIFDNIVLCLFIYVLICYLVYLCRYFLNLYFFPYFVHFDST